MGRKQKATCSNKWPLALFAQGNLGEAVFDGTGSNLTALVRRVKFPMLI